jgi:hypothetical protein
MQSENAVSLHGSIYSFDCEKGSVLGREPPLPGAIVGSFQWLPRTDWSAMIRSIRVSSSSATPPS